MKASRLPDNIILFDGDCLLCHRFIQFIIRHDQKTVFHFASLRSRIGIDLLKAYGLSERCFDSIVFIHQQKAKKRSAAVLTILKMLNGPWNYLYYLIYLPHFVRDTLYIYVARNRFKWFGRENACLLPTPSLKNRMLDGTFLTTSKLK